MPPPVPPQIGGYINVFGRAIRILDADAFTRRFFEENGSPLGEPIDVHEEPVPRPKYEPPPYTAFTIGSEEDSLGSCYSLEPRPPKKDLKKLIENDRKQLRFHAKLVTDVVRVGRAWDPSGRRPLTPHLAPPHLRSLRTRSETSPSSSTSPMIPSPCMSPPSATRASWVAASCSASA